ncbi:insecticidal delta-endotoxin Cry8Ea1 family protein [Bacillus thuringiensis]|uniref:insecticidal delta-endotoxin Cry8Ea1 family protein n=1 Tax=Bacillus thuringiensis TaxID=1428 RepID=UPI003D0989DA|nr:insecticidal toxin protein [Bacillus thuringiensis]
MTKKHKKILSMTLATGVFAGTYIPIAYTAFAETEPKEDLNEKQTKNINQNNPSIDLRGWFENPYKGVTFDQFINAFNNNAWNPLLVDLKNSGNAGSGTLVFLKGMMGTGLSLLPPPASLLGSVWNIFMPSTNGGTDMWKQLETYIEEKIDSKINDYHKYLMGAEFNGAIQYIKEYQRVLQIYNDSKNSLKRVEAPGTAVITAARNADTALKAFIAIIQTPEKETDSVYQQITAPIFVQAANAHLLLQRDMILYGKEWGMDTNQWQGYKDNQKKLIQEYTNYAMKVYNDGLEKKKKEAENINTQQPNRNTDRWNHINNYVREYTLSVLDFVDLFPATNPETYSKGLMQENSRQIYSSIKGAVIPQGGTGEGTTWENIQKILDSQAYTGDLHKLDIRSYDRIDAIQPWYSDKLYGGSNWTTPGWTGNTTGGTLKTLINPSDNPITRVKAQSSRTPNYIDFKFDTGGDNPSYGRYISGSVSHKEDIFEYPHQKLSQVHAFNKSTYPGFEGIDAVVFGFVDKNLNESSTYLMTNMITAIPAAKYNRGMSNFQPQVESIHAKQKAMKTDTTNSYLAYGVEVSKEQEYKIRYKVAANDNSKISLSHRNPGGNYAKIADTTIPLTGNFADAVKGEYGSYKIVEGPTVKLTKGTHDLKLENSQGKFSIDQIELEPVEQDQVIAQDNFDDKRLSWVNFGGIVNGGVNGKAGMIDTNGNTWTYIQDQLLPFSKYTLSIKVKLNSTNGNERQNVTIYTDNMKRERITKTVELKGNAGYQEIQLEFITRRDLANTHVGILTSNGTSNILFDDVKVIGAKK